MEPSESKLPEINPNSPHASEDTEKIEKIESDKNSVDILGSSKKEPREEKTEEEEKLEKIEQPEKAEVIEQPQTSENPEKEVSQALSSERLESSEKVEPFTEKIEGQPTEKFDKPVEKSAFSEESKETKEMQESPAKKPEKHVQFTETPPSLLSQMDPKVADLFKKTAAVKKMELEAAPKPQKSPPKKRVLSEEEIETLSLKKSRFAIVKKWDNERSQILNQMITLADKLMIRLDQKLRGSNAFSQGVICFLTERIRQETEFVRIGTKITRMHGRSEGKGQETRTKPKKEEIPLEGLSGMERFLLEFDDAHLNKWKTITDYCVFLEKTLINEVLKSELDKNEKEMIAFKKGIDGMKKKVSELNFQTGQRAKNYSKIFSETINDEGFEVNEKKDLLLWETMFFVTARRQSKAVTELLGGVIGLLLGFIAMEKRLRETVKKVFSEYIAQTMVVHGAGNFEDLVGKIQGLSDKDLEETHSMGSFALPEELRFFGRELNSLSELHQFVTKEFEGVTLSEESSLVREKFRAFVKIGNNYEPSWLYFSRDKNLIIWRCDSEGSLSEEEPWSSIRVEGLGVYLKERESLLEIVQSVSGILFNTKKTITVKAEVLDKIIGNLQKK